MTNKLYYKKSPTLRKKKQLRFVGLGISIIGFLLAAYFFFPLVSWQIYFAPVFASQSLTTPIPTSGIITQGSIQSLITTAAQSLSGVDYTNAQNWYPMVHQNTTDSPQTSFYYISIPRINITNAIVSTVDNDLQQHLVNYGGTAIPPEKGNAVIFGHSTLPQLYNPKDYKTIFANAHKLQTDDLITVKVNNVEYTYRIFKILVVNPEDTSVLAQDYDDRYLTIITCTPPGTIWKRLVVKARLENI